MKVEGVFTLIGMRFDSSTATLVKSDVVSYAHDKGKLRVTGGRKGKGLSAYREVCGDKK